MDDKTLQSTQDTREGTTQSLTLPNANQPPRQHPSLGRPAPPPSSAVYLPGGQGMGVLLVAPTGQYVPGTGTHPPLQPDPDSVVALP